MHLELIPKNKYALEAVLALGMTDAHACKAGRIIRDSGQSFSDVVKSVAEQIASGTWKRHHNLLRRRGWHVMEEDARQGHVGEEAWTNMDEHGLECTSSAVHIVGFMIGYSGFVGHTKTVTTSRKGQFFQTWDHDKLMPAFMKQRRQEPAEFVPDWD